jgi:hypothetical protein
MKRMKFLIVALLISCFIVMASAIDAGKETERIEKSSGGAERF